MALTTVTQITAPVNRVYQTNMLAVANQRCAYFVGTMAGDLVRHGGSFTLLWKRIEQLTPTTSALSELTGNLSLPTRTATQLSETEVTATVAKYGDIVHLTEEVDLLHPANQVAMARSDRLGEQAGRSLNRLQRNIHEDNATLIYASGGSADGDVADAISTTLIRNAVNQLNRNSAERFSGMSVGSQLEGSTPIRDSFWGFCHVDVEEDLRDLADFKPVETYASHTSTMPFECGMAGGVRWIATEEASIDTGLGGDPGQSLRDSGGAGAADLYTAIILGKEAFGSVGFGMEHVKDSYKAGDTVPTVQMIFKPFGSAGAGDPLDEISTLSWKAWHAGAQLNADWSRGLRIGARKLD